MKSQGPHTRSGQFGIASGRKRDPEPPACRSGRSVEILGAVLMAVATCGCLQGYDRTVVVHVRDPSAVRVEVAVPGGTEVILPANGPRDVEAPLPRTSPPVRPKAPSGSGLAVRREVDGAVTISGGEISYPREILGADGTSRTFSFRDVMSLDPAPDRRVFLSDGEVRVSCPVYLLTGRRRLGWYMDVDLVTPVANVVDAREIRDPHRLTGVAMLVAGVVLVGAGSAILALPGRTGKQSPAIPALVVGFGLVPGAFLTGTGLFNLLVPRTDQAVFSGGLAR